MRKSIVTATLALGLVVAPGLSRAQEDNGHNSIGTSRASSAAGRTREDTSTLRTRVRSSKAAKPRNWHFQFLNQAYTYQHDLSAGERPVASNYTYVGVSYKFKPSQYIAFRIPFSYYMPKIEGESHFTTEDAYFNYWNAELKQLTQKTTLSGMLRLYLPTGEDSHFNDKRAGALRATAMTLTDFGHGWNLNYTVYGQYNNNTQETYKWNDRTYACIDRSFVQGATLGYDFNDKWNLSQLVGTTSNWAETGDRYSDTEHFLNLVSTIYYQVTPQLSASLGFHDDVEIGDDMRPFRLGMDEDITYILSVAATL